MKLYIPIVIVSFLSILYATIDDTQGFYRAGNPILPYLNNASSYYINPPQNYYWDGQGWVFKTGFKVKENYCTSCDKNSCCGGNCAGKANKKRCNL